MRPTQPPPNSHHSHDVNNANAKKNVRNSHEGLNDRLRFAVVRRRTFVAIVVLMGLAIVVFVVQAANRTWANTGTDFNAGASWGGTPPGSGDVAVFSTAEVTQPNLSASLTIQELNFSAVGASGYDLTSSNA